MARFALLRVVWTSPLKRERLIDAAKEQFYQYGIARTTLAEIAQRAQVPLGNVYYHFRRLEAWLDSL